MGRGCRALCAGRTPPSASGHPLPWPSSIRSHPAPHEMADSRGPAGRTPSPTPLRMLNPAWCPQAWESCVCCSLLGELCIFLRRGRGSHRPGAGVGGASVAASTWRPTPTSGGPTPPKPWERLTVGSILPVQGPGSSSCLPPRETRSASCSTASSEASPPPRAPSGCGRFSQVSAWWVEGAPSLAGGLWGLLL